MPSYTIRATDKETGEIRLMKVKAGTPMTEVIKQYAELSGIDEAECRFLVGGKPLHTEKPLDEQVKITTTAEKERLKKKTEVPNNLDQQIVEDDVVDCSACSCMPSY
ncbi:hypothetical protein M885DRAFT_588838 [Pelagophyceae sp. CCMP2097]|nr:hypothetical protein M885DRAFT_588838 [Pelagophyceae sp. CCMP2097]